jgi:single-stranded DNA-binding protein
MADVQTFLSSPAVFFSQSGRRRRIPLVVDVVDGEKQTRFMLQYKKKGMKVSVALPLFSFLLR